MKNLLIALDIGNVCLKIHNERVMQNFGVNDFPKEAQKICFAYSTGKYDTAQWLEQMRDLTKGAMSDRQIIDAWNSMLGDPITGMQEAVQEAVANGIRFVFFSDTCPSHMTWIRRNLPFCHLVIGSVLSYEVGACKPDPKMYQAFESKYGKPDLYFDDLAKNISGGKNAGWNVVQFSDAQQFAEILRNA